MTGQKRNGRDINTGLKLVKTDEVLRKKEKNASIDAENGLPQLSHTTW